MHSYLRTSRSAFYGVIAALPLLVGYELLLVAGGGANAPVRNAGDVWLRMVLASLQISPAHATLVMILVLVLAAPMLYRQDAPLRALYVAGVLVESVAYSLVLGALVHALLQFLYAGMAAVAPGLGALASPFPAAGADRAMLQALALSLGAGLFEEFLFRVVLLAVLLWSLRLILAPWLAATTAIVAAAALFSWAHYIGPFGDPFSLPGFLFRFTAGLLFTGLYYARGFAVTAWTHALYDVRLVLF